MKHKRFTVSKSLMLLLVMAALIAVFYLINSAYLSADNIRTILTSASLSGTIAVGMSLLIISGHVDLSSGATGMMGGLLVATLLQTNMPWPVALFITLLFGCATGLIISFFVNVLNFTSFITTLAIMTALSGVGLVMTNAENIAINNQGFWTLGTINVFELIPLPFFIMLLLCIIYGLILRFTKFGRSVYMCGGNAGAARLAGINPRTVHTILFVNNSAIACLAGSLLASRMHNANPSAVMGTELTAITSSVLGGISFMGGSGTMGGVFIGIMLLNVFTNGLVIAGFSAYTRIVAQGALLIAALILDFYREEARQKTLRVSVEADAE